MRIDPALKEAAMRMAQADRRSLTAYIEKLIEDDMKARGMKMPTPDKAPRKRS